MINFRCKNGAFGQLLMRRWYPIRSSDKDKRIYHNIFQKRRKIYINNLKRTDDESH
jgi:hypothetical protein